MEVKMSDDKGNISYSRLFTLGLFMGTADAVPGVSGGTIALIMGIYRRLIRSISECLDFVKNGFSTASKSDFISSINFLLPLGIGMLFAYYIVTKILVGPEDSPGFLRKESTAPYIFAFFFGLVLVSVREPWSFVPNPNYKHYSLAFFGAFVVFIYSSFSVDYEGSHILFIIGGAFALTAMLLPGVSGALVLLTLGQYTVIASSFHGGDLEPFFFLVIGGIIGLFTFVPLMNYMISKYLDTTMAMLSGLLFGSLITLWPWKKNYDGEGLSPNLEISQIIDNFTEASLFFTFLCLIVGMFSSYGLKHLEIKKAN